MAHDLWEGRCKYQEIEEGVFITNFFGAKDKKKLRNQQITHILVCAAELPTPFTGEFTYHQLPLRDNTNFPIQNYFEEGLKFISEAKAQGGKVLLHCAAGSSRSGTFAIAYKMKTQNLGYDEAAEKVISLRPIVQPNPGFVEVLRTWEETIHKM
jgi:protein-tyrosine phosphatase